MRYCQFPSEIENTRQKLLQEIQKEVQNLQAEYSVMVEKEKGMQDTLDDFEKDALDTNRKQLKYTIFERNVETNQKMYDILLDKVKESNILGKIDVSNLRIAQEAVIPHAPIKPKKKLNILLSIIFGIMTGVGLAFLWEYLDRSLRKEEDVQRYLGLPVVAVIPLAEKSKGSLYGKKADPAVPMQSLEFKL